VVRQIGHDPLPALQVLHRHCAVRILVMSRPAASMAISFRSRCERGTPSIVISNCAPGALLPHLPQGANLNYSGEH
jgi:hypothetical protein